MIADAHHHLWNLRRNRYPWLQTEPDSEAMIGDYSGIRRDYLVSDFVADCEPAGVVRSVHVQAEWDPGDPVGDVGPASAARAHGSVTAGLFRAP